MCNTIGGGTTHERAQYILNLNLVHSLEEKLHEIKIYCNICRLIFLIPDLKLLVGKFLHDRERTKARKVNVKCHSKIIVLRELTLKIKN